MHLYFVRHGQSENNLLWAQSASYEGRVADPALTAAGEEQAELLAQFLTKSGMLGLEEGWDPQDVEGFGVTHVYTSLMERAVATGHQIAEALDLPLLGWIDIHETGGMFIRDQESDTNIPQPGHSRSNLLRRFPRLVLPDEVTEAGWWNQPFEPKEARTPRARRVVQKLLAKHGGQDHNVVFVSHGGFFNHLLRVILDLPDTDDVWFAANNASITHITFEDDRRVMIYQNRVDYLPRHLIT